MSGYFSVRRRFIFGTAFVLAWIPKAAAQTESTQTRIEAPSPSAIAGAKKEFESIKSVRDAALLPPAALPRVAVPEFHGPTPPSTTAPKTKPVNPEAKPANWLLDAMQKQDDSSRDPRSRDSRLTRSRSSVESRDTKDVSEEPDTGAKVGRNEPETEGKRPLVINPLTRYLRDWMTPQDLALLKPGLENALDSVAQAKNLTTANASELPLMPGGLNEFAFGDPSSAPSGFSPPTRENPYLESFKPEATGVAIATGPSLAPAPAAPTPIPNAMLATPQTPPPAGRIPEFAKPSNDEKYFKQLKRF